MILFVIVFCVNITTYLVVLFQLYLWISIFCIVAILLEEVLNMPIQLEAKILMRKGKI